MQDDGKIRPARFHSKKFNNAQMNYGITKKELLAVVDSVRHFSGVLQGHPVTVLTDHQALVNFMNSLQTNQMMIRWQERLGELDITIEHIDGKQSMIADTLSRAYKEPPPPSPEQSPPPTDHFYSTPVLPTTTTQDLTVNLRTSTTSHPSTTMPSQITSRQRMSNLTGRYEDSDKYDAENWELKINPEPDENRRVWGPTQQLRTEAAAAMLRLR